MLWSLVLMGASSFAWADERSNSMAVTFNIPQQAADRALTLFAEQADLTLIFPPEMVGSKMANELVGTYTHEDGAKILLAGTGLIPTFSNRVVMSIAIDEPSMNAGENMDIKKKAGFIATIAAVFTGANAQEPVETFEDEASEEEIENIVVTGSRIKGVSDKFSPVIQLTRADMDIAGYVDVADFFEDLPQNFGDGRVAPIGNESVNLRGLGEEATLVLINGRRMAPGGALGSFVDVSTIPSSAIERVEVLTDGASAIYGSDAIAGVVNIILRDDFDGAETRLGAGTTADGGGDYLRVGQTLGWSNDRANAMLTYAYSTDDEVNANQRDFSGGAVSPSWLSPSTRRNSIFVSTGFKATDRITFDADGFFNDRNSKMLFSTDSVGLQQRFFQVDLQQYGGAIGISWALENDWQAGLAGNYSKSDYLNGIEVTNLSLSDSFSSVTEVYSFDSTIGGPLFSITNEPVSAVVGVSYRHEAADLMRVVGGTDIRNDVDKERSIYAVFGEIYAPIVSESDRITAVNSLALTAAIRYEEYSDVGSSLDPKIGFSWSPLSGLNVRGTYGTSFRAARLDQLIDNVSGVRLGIYADPMAVDGTSIAINVTGTRADVDPEESETWTVGFDLAPESIDGLQLRGTYFNTNYTDRLGAPSQRFNSSFYFSDFTGVPIRDFAPGTAVDFCNRARICVNLADFFPSFGDLDIEDTEVILDRRQQNLSISDVAGIDFEASYDFSSGLGDWTFSLGGTRLTTFEQRVSELTPVDDLLNTFGNPPELRLRGGAQLRMRAATASLFINHTGSYIDDKVATGEFEIDSFTTIDASVRFDLGELLNNDFARDMSVNFSIRNVLNEQPPEIGSVALRDDLFDAANSNAAGRKIGLLLTGSW